MLPAETESASAVCDDVAPPDRAPAPGDGAWDGLAAWSRPPTAGAPAFAQPLAKPGRRAGQSGARPASSRTAGLLHTPVTGLAKLLAAAVVTYSFLFNFSVVRGNSMSPSIHDGDRILIDHVSYWFGDVERGDIVVLKYPLDPSVDYIKRVIGLPGDDVLLEDGEVWVNGVRVEEPYVADVDRLVRQHVRVKPAHFFVLGDNRVRSSDSRDFGLVPKDYLRGKVEVRLWPPSRFGRLD